LARATLQSESGTVANLWSPAYDRHIDRSGSHEVLQVPRTVDSLILSEMKGSQNVRKANVRIKARPSPAFYS
jgi:hypothetical protein